MMLILRGKRLGFTLHDIGQFLDLRRMSIAISDTPDRLRHIELHASAARERDEIDHALLD